MYSPELANCIELRPWGLQRWAWPDICLILHSEPRTDAVPGVACGTVCHQMETPEELHIRRSETGPGTEGASGGATDPPLAALGGLAAAAWGPLVLMR